MSPEMPLRDIRYQCLVTVLAIILFLPILFLLGMLGRAVEMMAEFGGELPGLSRFLSQYPLATLIFFLGMMVSTIFFAWCNHKGAILASLSLLFQGLGLGLLLTAIFLPWSNLMTSITTP
jgi:hypothetical protein